jgi:hypothetical protein
VPHPNPYSPKKIEKRTKPLLHFVVLRPKELRMKLVLAALLLLSPIFADGDDWHRLRSDWRRDLYQAQRETHRMRREALRDRMEIAREARRERMEAQREVRRELREARQETLREMREFRQSFRVW